MNLGFLPIPALTAFDLCRFWNTLKVVGKCLLWQGYCNKGGYGLISVKNKRYITSRVAYAIHFRTDPGSLMVCHECNNPSCVRAEHLFLGTGVTNAQHRELEGRRSISGMLNPSSKLWDSDIPKILELSKTQSIASIARKYGMDPSSIRAIIRGETYVG